MRNRFVALVAVLCSLFWTNTSLVIPIPDHKYVALMARYVMHKTDWISIATISSSNSTLGFPAVNLASLSDGTIDNSTGVPYLFLTDLDFTGRDLEKNSRCSIMSSLAESNYCSSKNYDPQDPRCVRILINGRFTKLTDKSNWEYKFAKKALFSRHPEMKIWEIVHAFYIGKINIEQIGVLDYFGGIKYVTVKDYFDANINSTDPTNFAIENVAVVNIDGDVFST